MLLQSSWRFSHTKGPVPLMAVAGIALILITVVASDERPHPFSAPAELLLVDEAMFLAGVPPRVPWLPSNTKSGVP